MASLPPGFRFHPTDVELIMYYLKRKIMGKKLLFDAITELNIYKFSPWDLPEKCCYKSKDLEWYFFCPREKKYASGARMNRATETGYWKTTGKDRSVFYDEKVVGSVKTLIFHQGHPPRGQRTDWVIHEYKFEDKGPADAGFVQDSYVLCKVFQKSGLGPKNGAQYGAPFKESDWEDDEVPAEPCTSDVLPAPPGLPENQCYSIVTSMVDPGSTSGWPSSESTRTSIQKIYSNERGDGGVLDEPNPPNVSSVCRIPLDEPDVGELPSEPNPSSFFSAVAELPGKHTFPFGTGVINPGPGPGPSSAQPFTSEMPLDEQDDEIIGLLAHFREDPFLPTAGNENNQNLENFNQDINAPTLPFTDENDIYDGLGDISSWAGQGQSSSNFSASGGANYSLNPMILPEDAAYMELNDLDAPLNHSTGTIETGQLGLGNFGALYNSNIDMRQLCFGSNSLGIDHALENQLPMLPESYTEQVNPLDMVYNFQNNGYQGCDAATNISFSSYKRPEDNRFAAQNLERGAHQRKFYSSIFALSGSLCGGTFILVKAEVTLGIGCTYDALSAMLGDPCFTGSLCGGTFILVKAEVTLGIGCTYDALSAILGDPCFTLIYQSSIEKSEYLKEVNGAFYFGFSFAFICFSRLKRIWFYTFWILNDFIYLKILVNRLRLDSNVSLFISSLFARYRLH